MGLVEGKVIIVTGASSGIGEKTAEVLAAEGAKVVLAARRKEKLEDVANRIIAAGGEAIQSVVMSVSEKIATRIAEETVRNTVASMCLSTMQVSVTNRCLLQDAVMTGGDRLSQSIRILYSTCQEQPLFIWKNGVKALSSIFLPSAVYLQTQVLLTVQQKQPLWL